MSKRTTRLLSLILTLVMFLSVATPAYAWGPGDFGGDWDRDIGDDEVRDLDVEVEEAEEEYDYFQALDEENNVQVTIEAPMGSLPSLAEVRLEPVPAEDLQEAVEAMVEGNPQILVAMDISFWLGEDEIEPEEPVRVKISAPELEGKTNLQVIHFPDDAEEPETIQLIPEEDLTFTLGTNEVAFQANSFSVYAVIGGTDETARLKVSFYKGDTSIASMFVKKSDSADDLKYIVYDPGVGEIGDKQVFRGWTTEENFTVDTTPMDIEDIRELVASRQSSIVEGETMQEIKLYALIYDVFTVTYIGKGGISMGSHTVFYLKDNNTPNVEYTINMQFTPDDPQQHFEGWMIASGTDNINSVKLKNGTVIEGGSLVPAAGENPTTLENGSKLYLKGDVELTVYTPSGFWLVFKENAKGATYNAALFVHEGETVVCPENAKEDKMKLAGFTFAGWYKDQACTDGQEFTFTDDLKITQNTTIYAKWTMADTATYTIVIWKQNVTGDGYDFEEAIQETGRPNTVAANVQRNGSSVTDTNGTYQNFTVDGTEKAYRGFHGASCDENVTITPQGNTVINVYYDRNTIKFQFYTFNATSGYTQDTGAYEEGVAYYGRFTNDSRPTATNNNNSQYLRIYYIKFNSDNQYHWCFPASIYNPLFGSSYYYYDANGDYLYVYNNNRYVKNGSWQLQNSMTMTGLYGSTLADNGYTWPSTTDWYAKGHRGGGVSGTRTTFLDAFLPTSESSTVNFYGKAPQGSVKVHFYKQNADKTGYVEANTVTGTGGTFFLSDKYTGYQLSKYRLEGQNEVTVSPSQLVQNDDGDWYYDANTSETGVQGVTYDVDLHIYFDRLAYRINFKDGTCFDGNPAKDPPVNGIGDGNVINEPKAADFGQSDPITYGADISGYGDPDNDLYKSVVPTKEGYVFCGWYSDETCQVKYDFDTMPLNGVTLFAKWHQIQYRVFLHPNAGTSSDSPDLDWGSDDQEMNFRISYGNTVSAPTGTRTGYKMVGWFLDPDFNIPYNPDGYPLNETNVTATYDKSTDFTDVMDKWGNGATRNSDLTGYKPNAQSTGEDRFWITKKQDVYLKWKAELPGADGISVFYDPNGGKINGSTARFVDGNLYEDNSKVPAMSAATAPAVAEGQPALSFQYWIVQKYENGEFVDTDVHVYPGNNFTVVANDCYVHADPNNAEKNIYEFQLKAHYDVIERVPTHITWYSNAYDAAQNEIDIEAINATKPSNDYTEMTVKGKGKAFDRQGVQINDGVEIPDPTTFDLPGYVFLGWGRVDVTLSKDYSLIGNINGYNQGTYDGNLLANYTFTDYGTLNTSFTADSYVFVKDEDGSWFMTDGWQPGATSVTLYPAVGEYAPADPEFGGYGNGNKLFVPKNQSLKFTLVENFGEDGEVETLTLSYREVSGTRAPAGTAALTSGSGITDPKELNGDNLFLKWVDAKEVTEGGETTTVDGHYETKVGDEWIPVTQVACDEVQPYNDLYAVWGTAFYVYHTGDNTVERVILTTKPNSTNATEGSTFDLTQLVDKDTYLYGGYYKSYADIGTVKDGALDTAHLTWLMVDDVTKIMPEGETASSDLNTLVQNGYVSKAPDTGATPYTGQEGAFTLADAYKASDGDAPGNAIMPEAGAVYYIKEVPADQFLQPRLRYTYRAGTGDIGMAWMFTNLDDSNYLEAGFKKGGAVPDLSGVDAAALPYATPQIVTEYEVTAKTTQTTHTYTNDDLGFGGTNFCVMTVYNKQNLYPENTDLNADIPDINILALDGSHMSMFWVTPDGARVNSICWRGYTGSFVNKQLKVSGGNTAADIGPSVIEWVTD